ncbi:YbjN domain-containing protein [Phorcysia thermohydrogeniphila]|uniref:Putative sensory transduction regulator n=1 Tax=Phorcysia thermohydrogeniphila TaxID=936138 RepID=A0A4R1G8P3_9BACT|nr:YbjN domain-containing protein [Phorcysia thermohydrogeniphila]TCK02930.1 putative sensory transduction regulator [Phorcysia thermohydrogeniphila]
MKKVKLKTLMIAASLCSSFAFTAPSYAVEIISAENPQAILNIAKGFGSAKLKKDSTGDPLIVGRIEGTKYTISFYGCSNGKNCKDILFNAAWEGKKISLEKINKWNRDKRFGKAYIDKDNTINLEMAVNLRYGVTEENLEDTFEWWKHIMKEFEREVLEK